MVGPLQILEMVTPRYFPLSTTPADVHARCMLFAEAVVCWRFEWPCTFSGGNSSATSTPIPLMLRDHPVTWLHLSGSRSDGRSGSHLQTVWHRSGTGVVTRTVPCGTPERTSSGEDVCPSRTTDWVLRLRKSLIQPRVVLIPRSAVYI